jgi:hypothetical protein
MVVPAAPVFSSGTTRTEDSMSLHLCYRLTLPGRTSFDEVRGKLGSLKRFAETLGFDDVLGPTEYTVDQLVRLPHNDVVGMIASTLSAEPPDFYGVPEGGCCATAFVIVAGAECEPAVFGFIAPGARSDLGGPYDDLRPGEWFWSSACQTKYASTISEDHFVRCHRGLVRVLDHAASLGIDVSVEDETGYWESRSDATLRKLSSDLNRLVGRLAEDDYRHWHERHQADEGDPEVSDD